MYKHMWTGKKEDCLCPQMTGSCAWKTLRNLHPHTQSKPTGINGFSELSKVTGYHMQKSRPCTTNEWCTPLPIHCQRQREGEREKSLATGGLHLNSKGPAVAASSLCPREARPSGSAGRVKLTGPTSSSMGEPCQKHGAVWIQPYALLFWLLRTLLLFTHWQLWVRGSNTVNTCSLLGDLPPMSLSLGPFQSGALSAPRCNTRPVSLALNPILGTWKHLADGTHCLVRSSRSKGEGCTFPRSSEIPTGNLHAGKKPTPPTQMQVALIARPQSKEEFCALGWKEMHSFSCRLLGELEELRKEYIVSFGSSVNWNEPNNQLTSMKQNSWAFPRQAGTFPCLMSPCGPSINSEIACSSRVPCGILLDHFLQPVPDLERESLLITRK